jgi:hypothetical protein
LDVVALLIESKKSNNPIRPEVTMHPPQGKTKSLGVLALIGMLGTLAYLHSRNPAPPAAPPAIQVILAPGTTVTVRLNQAVGSKVSASGQRFMSKLDHAVVVDGREVLPSGTQFSGTVIEAMPAGHLAGGAVLRVALASFTLNATDYRIQTTTLVRVSQGKGRRTATMAGGGAAIGALVGALAHRGKGALIGAAAGAAAGGAGSSLYGGDRDIVMPAESRITFKIVEPLTVTLSPAPHTRRV